MTKKQSNILNIILKLIAVLMFAAACVLFPVSFLNIEDYLAWALVRVVFSGLGIVLLVVFGFSSYLKFKTTNKYCEITGAVNNLLQVDTDKSNLDTKKKEGGKLPPLQIILVIVVVMLVSIFNFPFASLITGQAALSATAGEVFVFLFFNSAVAVFEEVFFRGLVLLLLFELFQTIFSAHNAQCITHNESKSILKNNSNSRYALCVMRYALPILISAVLFSLFHLFNLDLMQLGYTLLLGLIWGYLVFVTKTVWWAVIAHFVFNLGGSLITMLGSGIFFTNTQIIITAIIGVFCGVVLIVIESKRLKKLKPKKQ
ncbi:MAG: CPBP family intramembrane metalloprotease [Firmicutes bacterium]|nr:CPBP family intramembrane metalloprotease [Bacillota bacterium]